MNHRSRPYHAMTNAQLMRAHDRIRAVWQNTRWQNVARRCECRLSVIRSLAAAQCANVVCA